MLSPSWLVLLALGLTAAHAHKEWRNAPTTTTTTTAAKACEPTITTASGAKAPANICAGDLIFSDDFDTFDLQKWSHEITMSGGGNWEFQIYSNNRSNSFVQDGNLHIRPTLTSDQYGEGFLTHGVINLNGGAPADACTNPSYWGCERTGTPVNILNPTKSARIRTVNSFSFKYGRVEVRAKLPTGDWLWPAIWMMPRYNAYGTWPASGEIDISESRGNTKLVSNGVNIGTEQSGSTLHYGPYFPLNGFEKAHYDKNNAAGYNNAFHTYQVEWTAEYIKFGIDDEEIGTVRPPAGGFWELGEFASQNSVAENPWKNAGHMAPFDQEFYLILNLAVGGTNGFFPDGAENPKPKPWTNKSPQAFLDFWNAREDWLPTWNMQENNGADSSMQVDYVKVWAL